MNSTIFLIFRGGRGGEIFKEGWIGEGLDEEMLKNGG